jgi:membrane protease YdiL (CAAX protease family)
MSDRTIAWINTARAVIAAVIFAFVAGDVSQSLAGWIAQSGGPWFLREPMNACMAALFLLLWNKWQPSSGYSAPKWGSVPIGLALGLGIGILLPALALGLMVGLKLAVIKPPQVEAIALLVPFIFLIFHGFAEESLVRAIAQRCTQHSFGALAGIGASAIGFCALQALQGYQDVFHLINSLLFGACLGFLVLGPGGIWTAVGAHAGWSWLEIAALGQPGQIAKTQSILAGAGPDSYGSPLFSLVLLGVVGAQLALHLRAQQRTV